MVWIFLLFIPLAFSAEAKGRFVGEKGNESNEVIYGNLHKMIDPRVKEYMAFFRRLGSAFSHACKYAWRIMPKKLILNLIILMLAPIWIIHGIFQQVYEHQALSLKELLIGGLIIMFAIYVVLSLAVFVCKKYCKKWRKKNIQAN